MEISIRLNKLIPSFEVQGCSSRLAKTYVHLYIKSKLTHQTGLLPTSVVGELSLECLKGLLLGDTGSHPCLCNHVNTL